MKAVILSAGLGTRLHPLTKDRPKVMVHINGKPILWYHITLLKKYGIKDLWINLHPFPDLVKEYFGNGSKFGVNINYSFEHELLGTSGCLKNKKSGIEDDLKKGQFLVVYGDNLTNFDYKKLIDFHNRKKSLLSMGLYLSPEPWTMGVIETDKKGKIINMVEKPARENIKTNQVNAGIYVCQPEVLNYIPDGYSDWGFDIIPKILINNSLWAINTDSYIQDIGTHDRLKKAQQDIYKYLHFF